MAYVGEEVDVFAEAQKKVDSLERVSQYRDSIFASNEDKPMKILIAAGVGFWLIYHFLIRR